MGTIAELVGIDESVPDIGQALHERLQATKKQLGMWFFVLGGILLQIKKGEYWQGRAESWDAYCAAEGLGNYEAVQEKIRCYQHYVERLRLPEAVLEELATRDKTALSKAAPHITIETAEEWIKKLNTLGRQDIIAEIRENNGESPLSLTAVEKVVRAYRCLHQDERAEFHRIITEGKNE